MCTYNLFFVWSPYVIGQTIIFSSCGFFFFFCLFFPRLISAAADWMSTILPHMVWSYCEFKMQVWNLLHSARWKYRTQKSRHLGTIAQAPLHISTGFASWQHYCTASSNGRQPNFAALNRGRHLCLAGRPSRWALGHILVCYFFTIISDIIKLACECRPYAIAVTSGSITAVQKCSSKVLCWSARMSLVTDEKLIVLKVERMYGFWSGSYLKEKIAIGDVEETVLIVCIAVFCVVIIFPMLSWIVNVLWQGVTYSDIQQEMQTPQVFIHCCCSLWYNLIWVNSTVKLQRPTCYRTHTHYIMHMRIFIDILVASKLNNLIQWANNFKNRCVSKTHVPPYGALVSFWGSHPRPKFTEMGEAPYLTFRVGGY